MTRMKVDPCTGIRAFRNARMRRTPVIVVPL